MTRVRVLYGCLCMVIVGALTAQALSITLVAGSGYIFRDGEVAVGIDVFTTYNTTAAMQESMRAGEHPYDLDVILVTHSDRDHFNAALLGANMQTQTFSVVVGPTDVLTAIRVVAPELPETRFLDISLQSGQPVEIGSDLPYMIAFSFPHPPNGSRPNFGYLLSLDAITLFHPGDLDDTMASERFDTYDLASYGIDVAFLPYFMFTDSGLASAIGGLGARCLVPTHVRPTALGQTCHQTRSLFSNLLCFQQLGEEIEFVEQMGCGLD